MLEYVNLSAARAALHELALEDPLPLGSPPSTYAAYAAVTGEPGGWFRVAFTMTLRAGLIGAGLYASGQRGRVFRSAMFASASIELFVLGYASYIAGRKTR
jgi:hypothetical protein